MPGVFVTVGTTSFDALVEALDTAEAYAALAAHGYDSVVFQIGRGSYEPQGADSSLAVTHYRYNTAYQDDIGAATLVISHAGAGTIMDVLGQRKHLIVVPNTQLMDNHQMELATALAERHHLLQATVATLPAVLKSMAWDSIVPYPPVDEEAFPALVDAVMTGKLA
ncbi:UDP-N-acetylglucosamine transferase subunit [Achlya hypogyna]|uniref:UDP-N-acetylglucosamine transferase subunit ALG13 n=1 Tax=Achlya hypogyna TaxID=1202772 RepID=A0A1V9ZJ83_ACHHY|nr:UDP-N-acetylglucosamine transferase subunit [Achlya hypogyna]